MECKNKIRDISRVIKLVELDIEEAITVLSSVLYSRKPTENDMKKIIEAIRILKR